MLAENSNITVNVVGHACRKSCLSITMNSLKEHFLFRNECFCQGLSLVKRYFKIRRPLLIGRKSLLYITCTQRPTPSMVLC